jgi:hypothetical protein
VSREHPLLTPSINAFQCHHPPPARRQHRHHNHNSDDSDADNAADEARLHNAVNAMSGDVNLGGGATFVFCFLSLFLHFLGFEDFLLGPF